MILAKPSLRKISEVLLFSVLSDVFSWYDPIAHGRTF